MFYLRSWLSQLAQRLSLPTGLRSRKKIIRLFRKRAGVHLQLEELESRITPGGVSPTDIWTGAGTNNNWSMAANWNLNQTPTAADTVQFNSNATVTTDALDVAGALIISGGATVQVQFTGGGTVSAQTLIVA